MRKWSETLRNFKAFPQMYFPRHRLVLNLYYTVWRLLIGLQSYSTWPILRFGKLLMLWFFFPVFSMRVGLTHLSTVKKIRELKKLTHRLQMILISPAVIWFCRMTRTLRTLPQIHISTRYWILNNKLEEGESREEKAFWSVKKNVPAWRPVCKHKGFLGLPYR